MAQRIPGTALGLSVPGHHPTPTHRILVSRFPAIHCFFQEVHQCAVSEP